MFKIFAAVVVIAVVAISFAGSKYTAADLAQSLNGSNAIEAHVASIENAK